MAVVVDGRAVKAVLCFEGLVFSFERQYGALVGSHAFVGTGPPVVNDRCGYDSGEFAAYRESALLDPHPAPSQASFESLEADWRAEGVGEVLQSWN